MMDFTDNPCDSLTGLTPYEKFKGIQPQIVSQQWFGAREM